MRRPRPKPSPEPVAELLPERLRVEAGRTIRQVTLEAARPGELPVALGRRRGVGAAGSVTRLAGDAGEIGAVLRAPPPALPIRRRHVATDATGTSDGVGLDDRRR